MIYLLSFVERPAPSGGSGAWESNKAVAYVLCTHNSQPTGWVCT